MIKAADTRFSSFFSPGTDFLSHTLAHAQAPAQPLARPKHLRLDDGSDLHLHDTGILTLTPAQARFKAPVTLPTAPFQLIISAGLHGNETAPIEVLNGLLTEMLQGAWFPGVPALIILGNPAAMLAGERHLEHNLNRLFNGSHRAAACQASLEGKRAARLETAVAGFVQAGLPCFHYDLHTAIRPSLREKFALYPFVPAPQRTAAQPSAQQLAILQACDVHTLLLQHKVGSTFSAHTALNHQAESFTVELGQVRPFGQNDLSRFCAVRDCLRQLLMGQLPAIGTPSQVTRFQVVHEIINTGDGFELLIPEDVANFTEYLPGSLIWQDKTQVYRVGAVAESIVFPNARVPVGQRAGLMVRALC